MCFVDIYLYLNIMESSSDKIENQDSYTFDQDILATLKEIQ